jgi:Protein of unknown function (DUF4058)
MKTPFPGMDPYLEHPALWPSVHTRLMVALANQLRPKVRPRYVASVEDRVFVEGPEEQRVPDVWVQRVRSERRGAMLAIGTENATPVVVEVEELEELEVHEHYIAILDRYRDLKVVTIIEVVSPSNKAAGAGRDSYLAKQREIRGSECHLVEIDLLRRGRHVMSVPESYVAPSKPFDYLICVNRWPTRKRFELYPCRLRDCLPTVKVPLSEPDPDVPIDIQAAFEQVYEEGDYMLRVLYDQPCVPHLPRADQKWASRRWLAYRRAHPELFAEEERS